MNMAQAGLTEDKHTQNQRYLSSWYSTRSGPRAAANSLSALSIAIPGTPARKQKDQG